MNKHRNRLLGGLVSVPLVAGVMLLAGMSVALAAPGAPGVPAPQSTTKGAPPSSPNAVIKVTSDGWIEYPSVLEQAGVTAATATLQTVTVKGVKTKDGCAFSDAGSAPNPASAVTEVYMEEQAYNPNSCHSRVVIAEISPEQLAAIASITGDTTDLTSANPPVANPLSRSIPTVQYSYHLTTQWIDPIGKIVAGQTVDLSWNNLGNVLNQAVYPRTGCVLTVNGGKCVDQTTLVSSNMSSSGISVTGTSKSQNSDFSVLVAAWLPVIGPLACGGSPSVAATFSFTSTISGNASGGYSWSYNDTKSGTCSNLLHHNQVAIAAGFAS